MKIKRKNQAYILLIFLLLNACIPSKKAKNTSAKHETIPTEMPQKETPDFVGKRLIGLWEIQRISQSEIQEKNLFFRFNNAKSVSIVICNNINFSYEVLSSNTIKFQTDTGISTAMACLGKIGEIEDQVNGYLNSVQQFAFQDTNNRLLLFDENGQELIQLTRKAE